jgi:hypothetical protein
MPVNQTCHVCGKAGPVAEDQTEADTDELAVDTRLLTCTIPDWACGECLKAAEDALASRRNPNKS